MEVQIQLLLLEHPIVVMEQMRAVVEQVVKEMEQRVALDTLLSVIISNFFQEKDI